MADALTLAYWCARTTLTISGTVTAHFDETGKLAGADKTSVVSLGCEADPGARHDLHLTHRAGSQEFDLRLAPDGRLAGAGFDDEGAGAAVIGATLSVVSLGATVAGALLPALGIAPQAQAPAESDQVYWRELQAREREVKELIDRLQQRAIAVAATVDAGAPPSLNEIKSLSAALALLRREEAKIEAAMKAWRAAHFPDRTTTFTYTIAAGELEAAADAPGTIQVDVDGLAGDIKAAASTLHMVVRRVEPPADVPARAAHEDEAIFYRLPRRVHLAIYEHSLIGQKLDSASVPSGPQDFHLRQLLPVWIIDSRCETHTVPITHSLFGKHSATLEFGDTGALSHVANTDVGGAGNVADAITNALGGSAGAAAPSAAADGKASPAAATDPTLAALQAEVALAQLEASLATANKTIRDSQ